jgi:hypothetical protein
MNTTTLNKKQVIQVLERFPEQFSFDQLEYACDLLSHVQEGLKDIEDGNIYTMEQIKKMLDEDNINAKSLS